jgi:hypothetical protein
VRSGHPKDMQPVGVPHASPKKRPKKDKRPLPVRTAVFLRIVGE